MRTDAGGFLLTIRTTLTFFALAGSLFTTSCDDRSSIDKGLCGVLERGDTNGLQRYFDSNGNVNRVVKYAPYERFQTLLINIPIANGHLDATKLLLGNGADPNLRDPQGETPVAWVIGRTRLEVSDETRAQLLKILINAGADPNLIATEQTGNTPLMQAAFFGKTELVNVLLASGSAVNATNRERMTALHFAANAEVAKALLAAGADPTSAQGGETPAESALRHGHFSALTVLTNQEGWTNKN